MSKKHVLRSKKEVYHHAIHNKEIHDKLLEDKNAGDWVITTAFYSALHFVKAYIFPLDVIINGKSKTFNTFEHYYAETKLRKGFNSKHESLVDIVHEEFSSVGSIYDQLHDLSHTARYKNYKMPQGDINLAVEHINEIKSESEGLIEQDL